MPNRSAGALFGVKYFKAGSKERIIADPSDPYYYETFVGGHEIRVERGDCAYWLEADLKTAHLTRGPATVRSEHFCTLVRGYAPENRSTSITNGTVLPYVNGCSTKQLFPPDRPGDPTLQMLLIPPQSSEQAHHIHSTVRSVYVLAGRGTSVVGMNKKTESTTLEPGMVCILERMCPHHFETADSPLLVLPVHVWSTSPHVENNHPMYNGTFRM